MASGVLKPQHSPGNIPIFVIRKQGGLSWRGIQDFRKCNERSHPDRVIMCDIREGIIHAGNFRPKLFSTYKTILMEDKEHHQITMFLIVSPVTVKKDSPSTQINLVASFFTGITSFLNIRGIAKARGVIKNLAKIRNKFRILP